jgi:two-component system CheB/CheR fusion protein
VSPSKPAARVPGGADVLVSLAVGLLYVGAAKFGLALAIDAPQVTAVWPPTGLALAAVFLLGRRAVVGVLLGAFAANVSLGEPVWVAAGIAVGNTLEAVVGAALLRRFGFDGRLARSRDVLALFGALAIAPAVSATIGVAFLGAGGVQPVGHLGALFWLWWLADALGGLVFAPLLLVWASGHIAPRRRFAVVEALSLGAGLLAGSAVAFTRPPPAPLAEYSVFPFLIWGALRFGPVGSATVAAVADAIAVWATHLGLGPFAGAGPESGLVLLQIFMAVATATGLILGAIAAEQRRAEENARVSERRLVLALEAAGMGVWDWNIATGEVRWSGELEPLHGLPRGGFAGTYEAFRTLIHPDDRDHVEEAIKRSVETRTPYEAEFRILGADGRERWTDARGQVVEDELGRPVRMVGVGIDVTRRKRLEEQLRRHAQQLSETDRRKDEFLAMLSHELRNPLAPILHAAELLEHGNADLARQAREIIRRQSAHLTRLVDDLLDVSRITRGTVRLERRAVPIREVVDAAADTWRHLLSQKNQVLTIDLPPDVVRLDCDSTRLAQVVSNLLHNAIKFTPEGGRISIAAKREDGAVAVRVRDDGIGMAPEQIERFFDLFVQGPPSLDRPQGGLGLGLTLARRLAELHGGTVEARSEGPGFGSEFTVRVPVGTPGEEPPAKSSATDTSAATPRRARRVLVVDDNEDAREALRFLLEDEGHDVRTAGDGVSALAETERFSPEVVLLDIGLPGLDGYEVARAMRMMDAGRNALLVAVSGYGLPEDRARSRAAGFDDHLLKPVSPEILLDLVRRAS